MAIADSTNGAARSRRVSPRAIRAKRGKSAIPNTSTTFRKLGPSTPTIATTKRRYGSESCTSQSRIATSSTHPRA